MVASGLIRAALMVAAVAEAGCGRLPRNAVPAALMNTATLVPDIPGAREAAGTPDATMQQDMARSFEQESAAEFPMGPDGVVH